MTIYRGYEIKTHANGGFYWTDERNFDHTGNVLDIASPIEQRTDCFATEEKAMDSIDAYKRNLRAGEVA